MINTCLFGDCRDSLDKMKQEGITVQTCVTSPPYYGLRSYLNDDDSNKYLEVGLEQSPEEYIQNLVEVFRKVREVLSDDGTLWVNIGDSYYNYRPGGKSYTKQTIASTDQDLPKVSAKRNRKLDNLKEKDLIGIPWMLAFALRNDGWYLRQDIIWNKPNPMPESVKDRCTKSHEYIFLLSKNRNYYFDNESIKEPSIYYEKDKRAGKGNIRYEGKRTEGDPQSNGQQSFVTINETKNKRSVWTVTTKPYKGAHFATYPEDLIEPCILASSRVGDIVLDPFLGSGTTARVAERLNRNWVGCELNADYKSLQDERLGNTIIKQMLSK